MEAPNGGESTGGQIKAHNLHLLTGDDGNDGANVNGSGYAPGQNAAQRPISAESHSSEDSRQLDQSPTGNQSDDSLEAETKYQEELKERLRKSFADLEMNPDGVLDDSLEEDDGLRDSLDDLPQHNQQAGPLNNNQPLNHVSREGTFVKAPGDQNNKGIASVQNDPQLQDSFDATQDDNNNKFDDTTFPLQDSLDGTKDSILDDKNRNGENLPGDLKTEQRYSDDQNEPTSHELVGSDKPIGNNMHGYPAMDPSLKSSHHSNNNHGGSKPSSRRNSKDSGKNSPKASAGSTHFRLKDSPSHKKPPSGISNDSQRLVQQERKKSSHVNSRRNSRDSGSAGSIRSVRQSSKPKPIPIPIPGKATNSRNSTSVNTKAREGAQSEFQQLRDGEEVRVEYISDDSDDEDMHFVDEEGSPVDNFGLPLNQTNEDLDLRRQYRIKPAPPKEPSPREQQAINIKRTGVAKVPHSRSEIVIETVGKTKNEEVGVLESTKPPAHNQRVRPQEPRIQQTQMQQGGPLPPNDNYNKMEPASHSSPIERLESSKYSHNNRKNSSNQQGLFGEVRISSHAKGSGIATTPNSASEQRGDRDPDPYVNLRFDMQAVKQAAAKQEAALRYHDSSPSKNRERSSSLQSSNIRNYSGNRSRENRPNQSPNDIHGNADYSHQNGDNFAEQFQQQQPRVRYDTHPKEARRLPDDRQLSENTYHTQQLSSGHSERSEEDLHYQDYDMSGRLVDSEGQSWQGSASSSIRQPVYDDQNTANQLPQYDMTQNVQPVRTQEPPMQYVQNPPVMDPRTNYPYPMQSGVVPNIATNYDQIGPANPPRPMQSGFDPSLSGSYQQPNAMHFRQSMQQPQQQQWQDQQQGYSQGLPQPAQLVQQPSQYNMYGQHTQGPVHFNEGGSYQQAGGVQNMQQPQFYEQSHQGQQIASAPPLEQSDYPDFPMHGNGPFQMYQQPQFMDSYQMPNSQVPYQEQASQPPPHQRQIQNGQRYSQPAQQMPVKTGPDFITRNKQYLRSGQPKRTYTELYSQKKDTHAQSPPLNPRKPLPGISRENSQNAGGETDIWAEPDNEAWTRQLVEEQKQMALLMRGQSENNLTGRTQTHPPVEVNPRNSQGHSSSWSADHATAYARMQATQKQPVVSPKAKVAFDDEMYNSFESEDLMISPRGSNSHPNSKRTNSYPTLPGIPSQKKEDRQSPLRTSDPDGYLVKLQKAKQKPQYKEYTLKDYRNLKKDVKLGGLGPDLDMASERQDKVNKQRDYAKAIMEQNKKALQHAKNKPWHNKSTTPTKKVESASKRNLAIEYAKNIPKPPKATPPEEIHDRLYGASSRQQEDHQEAVAEEMAKLEELKARHMKEKEEVDKLRTEIHT